jgi:hypothetical protein
VRTKSISLTSLMAVGAAVVAITAAPTAMAATPMGAANPAPVPTACGSTGPGTECVTPGNAQLNDSLPVENYYPYGDFGLALGGFGGSYHGMPGGGFGGFGGGHGGGGHGGR